MVACSLAKLMIILIGLVDTIIMTASLCGFTMFLMLEPPKGLDKISTSPTLQALWYYSTTITCSVFWMSSINLSVKTCYSSLQEFRMHAFPCWMTAGIFTLFMSLLGNTLTNNTVANTSVIIIRITFISIVWLSQERWAWHMQQLQLDFSVLAYVPAYAPAPVAERENFQEDNNDEDNQD